MTIMRHCQKVLLVAIAFLASMPVTAESVFERLDSDRLEASLTQLQMVELLKGLSERTGDKAPMISAFLIQAKTAKDPADRDKYLAEASELLRQTIKDLEAALKDVSDENKFEEMLLQYYQLRMRQIDVAVFDRGNIYIDRMLMLLGGSADEQELNALTELGISQLQGLTAPAVPSKAIPRYENEVKELDAEYKSTKDQELRSALAKELEKTKKRLAEAREQARWGDRSLAHDISESRKEPRKQVYLVPELENISSMLNYKSAYLNYYQALSMPKTVTVTDAKTKKPVLQINARREAALRKAISDIAPYAQQKFFPLRNYARLLLGRCWRELAATQTALKPADKKQTQLLLANADNFKRAATEFDWVASQESAKNLLLETKFEQIRNNIEYGSALVRGQQVAQGEAKLNAAAKEINEFAGALASVTSELNLDVRKLVLDYYLNEQWGGALRDVGQAGKAANNDKKIQKAFLAFTDKYKDPGIQAQIGELFAKKFRGQDTEKLDPVIIMLLAKMEARQADRIQGGNQFFQMDKDAQAKITKHRHKARDMLEKIRKSNSPAAKSAMPSILFELGAIYVKQGHEPNNNFMAAEAFRELVKNYPNDELAKIAALNAVKINTQLIDLAKEENRTDISKRREDLVESLKVLLANWAQEQDVAPFHFDLAWQADQLYQSSDDEKWLAMAIENYRKVPQSSPQYEAAQGYGLDNQVRLIETKDEAVQKQMAPGLVRQLESYANAMHTMMNKTADPTLKDDYREFGSLAQFNACKLKDTILGEHTQAIDGINSLAGRWPGSTVLRDAQEFAIRSFVERGEIDNAISALDKFEKTYSARQAEGLVAMVVQKVRQAISEKLAANKIEEVMKFRQAYLKFAKQIYASKGSSPDVNQKYQAMSLYADALGQSDQQANATEALGIYQQMKQIEQQRQQKQQSQVAAYFNKCRAAYGSVMNNPKKLPEMVSVINNAAEEFGLGGWASSNTKVRSARETLKNLAKEGKGEKDINLKRAQRYVGEALSSLEKQAMRESTSIDASMMAGIAHCQLVLKQYDQAADIYRTLLAGLTPELDAVMYWQSQLELCQALMASSKSADDYKRLTMYIEQLRNQDRNLGGARFKGRLNAIDTEARKQLGDEG